MTRIILTGGTGYLGANLVSKLEAMDYEVNVIIRPASDTALLDKLAPNANKHIATGDISKLIETFQTLKPDIVIHLASLFKSTHTGEDIEPLINSNLLFSTQIVEAAASAGVTALINTGSSWQHYNGKFGNPVCLYAATKNAFEAVLNYYADAKSFRILNLLLYDTYGPHDPREKLLNILFKMAVAHDREPLSMSSGEQELDFLFIDDVVAGFIAGIKYLNKIKPKSVRTFALRSGEVYSLKDIIKIVNEENGNKLPVYFGRKPYREREVMNIWTGHKTLPGWRPKVKFRDGIRICMNFVKNS